MLAAGPYLSLYAVMACTVTLTDAAMRFYGPMMGSHGFDPAKFPEMKAIFFAAGPDIRAGATVALISHEEPLLDQVPTYVCLRDDDRKFVLENLHDLVVKAVTPDVLFPAHSAPTGLVFYTGDNLPAQYKGGAFIGEHGSWDRSPLSGYKVSFVRFCRWKSRDSARSTLWYHGPSSSHGIRKKCSLRLHPSVSLSRRLSAVRIAA